MNTTEYLGKPRTLMPLSDAIKQREQYPESTIMERFGQYFVVPNEEIDLAFGERHLELQKAMERNRRSRGGHK